MAYSILTQREKEVMKKRMNYENLNQLDSNILTKSVRPKLREMVNIDAKYLLTRLNYNPGAKAIEDKIKKLIVENIENVSSVIIYGSAIQTSYSSYNDIDVLIITKNKIWEKQIEKYKIINNLKQKANKIGLVLDIEILSKEALLSYSYNPTLIYQLKNHKKIYGKIDIPSKINLSKLDLRMKLDWSDIENLTSEPIEIYRALRNAILVKLLSGGIIDNQRLNAELEKRLGSEMIAKLKSNKLLGFEKRYVLNYLSQLVKNIRQEVISAKWEKIEL